MVNSFAQLLFQLRHLLTVFCCNRKFGQQESDLQGGRVDGCDAQKFEQGGIDTIPLITLRYALADIEEAYCSFENCPDGAIKIMITE